MKFIILLNLIGVVVGGPHTKHAAFIRNAKVGLEVPQEEKIIGGTDASPGEFPFQVSIQIHPYFGSPYHNCGGSILNPTHIVTAAHCVEGQILNQVYIVAGAHNMKVDEPSQQIRGVKRLIWHDDFDNVYLSNDSAIITLSSPLDLNEYVQPIKLANESIVHSGQCVNTGWGNANPTGGTPAIVPDALQKVTLEIVPFLNCTDMYYGVNDIDQTMMCARGLKPSPALGSCNGDSGGPLVCFDSNGDSYLAGLVSFGLNPCGQYEYPTVFADVANKGIRNFLITEANRE